MVVYVVWQGDKASTTESSTAAGQTGGQSGDQPDLFEDNFKELRKWVDTKSSKYNTLSVIREKRRGSLGTALKVVFLL